MRHKIIVNVDINPLEHPNVTKEMLKSAIEQGAQEGLDKLKNKSVRVEETKQQMFGNSAASKLADAVLDAFKYTPIYDDSNTYKETLNFIFDPWSPPLHVAYQCDEGCTIKFGNGDFVDVHYATARVNEIKEYKSICGKYIYITAFNIGGTLLVCIDYTIAACQLGTIRLMHEERFEKWQQRVTR